VRGRWGALIAGVLGGVLACGAAPEKVDSAEHAADVQRRERVVTFEDEVAYLRQHGEVVVLESTTGGRVAISPEYQARVMTSAVGPEGASLGFVHHAFIDRGERGKAFDNYGGEDRFWLGPEGGQFGLYFGPGAPFTLATWQAPHAMQEGRWDLVAGTKSTYARTMRVQNHVGTEFEVGVTRAIRVLEAPDMEAVLGFSPSCEPYGRGAAGSASASPAGLRCVAFETRNTITNLGKARWNKETGEVSVWILGMYNPAPDVRVLVPFVAGPGELVNDRYFGKVPAERLRIHDEPGSRTLEESGPTRAPGHLEFSGDGQYRSKIGLGPARAKNVLGSYSPQMHLLTVVAYDKPQGATDYVNSMWENQAEPYRGDVVNSYNDGPTEPGKPSLGSFYELETSSPAAGLAPGESLTHTHRTFHFVADDATLDALARRALGVALRQR
jgi:hypothetical protein